MSAVVKQSLESGSGSRPLERQRGIAPAAEGVESLRLFQPRPRVYMLKGTRTSLRWCRDKENTWGAEVAENRAPEQLQDMLVPLKEVVPLAAQGRGKKLGVWFFGHPRGGVTQPPVQLAEFLAGLGVGLVGGGQGVVAGLFHRRFRPVSCFSRGSPTRQRGLVHCSQAHRRRLARRDKLRRCDVLRTPH
ncbi:MAG: hypothetical protein R6U98_05965, partial [Pirellulaceae bacterium]